MGPDSFRFEQEKTEGAETTLIEHVRGSSSCAFAVTNFGRWLLTTGQKRRRAVRHGREFGLGTPSHGRYANVAGITIDGNQAVPTNSWVNSTEINLSSLAQYIGASRQSTNSGKNHEYT
jgi:hypothetical protein